MKVKYISILGLFLYTFGVSATELTPGPLSQMKYDVKCTYGNDSLVIFDNPFSRSPKVGRVVDGEVVEIMNCVRAGQYSDSAHMLCPQQQVRIHLSYNQTSGEIFFDSDGDESSMSMICEGV